MIRGLQQPQSSPAARGALGRLAGACALVALVGCSGSTGSGVAAGSTPDPQTSESAASVGGPGSLLYRMHAAPTSTHYRGTRRILSQQALSPFEYREEIGADGQGNFAVEPLEILSGQANAQVLILLLDAREGLTRYRDFHVRDVEQFRTNYTVTMLAPTTLLGQSCLALRVDSRNGHSASYYDVLVDDLSGLVLRSREFAVSDGRLLSEMEFETFVRDADLTGLQMRGEHRFPTESQNLDRPDVGFELLRPSLPPTGYRVLTIDKVRGPEFEWARFAYSDGLEMVFLMHRQQIASGYPNDASLGSVKSMPLGSWSIVTGEVKGFPLMMAGKVKDQDLFLMLQSSLAD
ncbi:MAG: hypothetical protein GY711_31415 [bacterium]|nr:hypothetical protein [bacterium]